MVGLAPLNRMGTRLRFIHRGLRYRYRVESAEVRFVLDHLSRGQSAVDIGAHKGAFTYWLSKRVGQPGRVYAFEPIPMLADYLREVVRVFPLPNVSVQQAALAAREEQRVLHIPRNNYLGTASFTPDANRQGHDRQLVTTYPLDLFVRSQGDPAVDFIKCDVEGHELEVLQGAVQTLRRCRPSLLMECEDVRHGGGQLRRVQTFLTALGYRCYALDDGGVKPYDQVAAQMETSGKRIGIDAYRNFAFLPSD